MAKKKKVSTIDGKIFVGIDPGEKGGILAITADLAPFYYETMPTKKSGEIDFAKVRSIIKSLVSNGNDVFFFLEQAVSFGMGTKGAFNYGRGFAALEIALDIEGVNVTRVRPAEWSKVCHDGITRDLKPKAKSIKALPKLMPAIERRIPKGTKGVYHEGLMDAALIAYYGRHLTIEADKDFY